MGEAGSAVEMGRLKAPVRVKTGIDQHQRRALRPDLRDMGSDIKKCTAAGRLRVTQHRLNRSGRPRVGPSEIHSKFILQESHQI